MPKALSRNGLERSIGPAGSESKRARAARVLRRGSDLHLSRIQGAVQRGVLPSSPTPLMAQQSRRHERARRAPSSHAHVHADAAVRRGRALRATGRAACCMRDAGVLRRRPPVLRTAGASHRHRGRTWGSVSASGSVEVSYGRLKTGTLWLSASRSLSKFVTLACAAEHAESAQPQRTGAVGRPGRQREQTRAGGACAAPRLGPATQPYIHPSARFRYAALPARCSA